MRTTLDDRRDPAIICDEHNWGKGTRLVGDEGYGPTVIQITAIGEEDILAKAISHNGIAIEHPSEELWVLWCRDWKEVA